MSNCTLYVPVGTKALYQAADGWKDFKFIEERNLTGIKSITEPASVYISKNRLIVNSSGSETVSIYSITGNLLYTTLKPAGEKIINIENVCDRIWIVRGSSGWARKIVR